MDCFEVFVVGAAAVEDTVEKIGSCCCCFADFAVNNTIQNCPSGGSLLKIWFQTQINTYKIESCNFINNYITDCYDLIGPTPHIWIENPFNRDHIYHFELILENCYFEKGSNTHKGGGLQYGKIKYGANIKLILNQ